MVEKIWKMLWSLAVPNSVKVFSWKACNNILPTEENLFKRTVVSNTVCSICERDEKIVIHALWACPAAQRCLGCGPIKLQKLSNDLLGFLNLVKVLMERCD